MSKTRHAFIVLLAASAFLLPGAISVREANAASPIIIRFASLAPPGSGFMKVMKAWNRSLKKETKNRVELRFYSGGSQGDERDFIRKVRAGQMDAAGVTTTGLGMVARPVLVLTAPGLITEYEQLERARTRAWTAVPRPAAPATPASCMLDLGRRQGSIASSRRRRFARPDDLKSAAPVGLEGRSRCSPEFVKAMIGANRGPGGRPTKCTAACKRGWSTRCPASALARGRVCSGTRGSTTWRSRTWAFIVGGSLVKKEKFEELAEQDRKVLLDTSARAGRAAGDTLAPAATTSGRTRRS